VLFGEVWLVQTTHVKLKGSVPHDREYNVLAATAGAVLSHQLAAGNGELLAGNSGHLLTSKQQQQQQQQQGECSHR
jgi:hypothetical protein